MSGKELDFNETLKWAVDNPSQKEETPSSNNIYKVLSVVLVLFIGFLLIWWIFTTSTESSYKIGDAILLASSPEYSINPAE